MDEDVDISPNASTDEIEMELIFQETLLQTLDPQSFSYQEDKERIERKIGTLQARYDAIAPTEEDLRGEAHEMLDDVLDTRAYFEEDDDEDNLASSLPTPSFLGAPSRKRPSDVLENFEKTKSRRTTPAPSPRPTGSPVSGLIDGGYGRPALPKPQSSLRPSALERALQSQRAAELRRAQSLEDERYARSLASGTSNVPLSRPTSGLGASSSSQAVFNRDGTYRKPTPMNGYMNGLSAPASSSKDVFGSYVPTQTPPSMASYHGMGAAGSSQGASNPNIFGFGAPSTVKSEFGASQSMGNGNTFGLSASDSWLDNFDLDSTSNTIPNLKNEVKAEPAGSRGFQDFGPPRSPIQPTNSSSSSLEEISPQDFHATTKKRPSDIRNGITYSNMPVRTNGSLSNLNTSSMQNGGYPMPSSYMSRLGQMNGNSTGMGYPSSHGMRGSPLGPVTGLVQNMANKFSSTIKRLGSQHDLAGLGSSFATGSGLYSGGKGNRLSPSSSSWYPGGDLTAELGFLTGAASAPIDVDDYPDRSRYDYLYSDPTRSAEEIKKLLENIRSDEDLPPEMRAGTPDEMSAALMEHQKLGLTWLKRQEEGTNKGAILADDMGLGKTIQAIALMVARASEDPRRKTNLIVAPVALLRQWELEIKDKIKPRYALKVFKHHGAAKKSTFRQLCEYDVVLTTFGTLAAESKRREKWLETLKENPSAIPTAKEQLALLGDDCLWYRVIIDEAQCIKNRNTASAKAAYCLQSQYRLCMTGTPMMNNVLELYSLIHFCRIRPFNKFDTFQAEIGAPIRNGGQQARDRAMQKLQGLIRATMLRRTKKSKLDGKPLISLPERTTNMAVVKFTEDETEFYKSLETQTRLQYNKYLKAGTVGRNYSCILVLLLRLRQACCHPHLIKDFGVSLQTDVDPETMIQLAKRLEFDVVARIKEADGAFACPICLDAVENPAIFIPCGHDSCSECFSRLTDPARGLVTGAENGPAETKCPVCRGKVDPKKITDLVSFKKAHQPELLPPEESAAVVAEEDVSDNSDSSESDEDSDDEGSSLDGFIVHDEDDDADSEERKPAKSKDNKKVKSKKGKDKATDKKPKTLAQLRKEGLRNKKAHRRYVRRLERDWMTSTKIEKTLSLLQDISQNYPREKILIFSQFTSFLDLLEVPLHRGEYNYRRYDGSMTANERSDAVTQFKENVACKIMLVSLKAGNAGLNLNCASHVILEDPFWNPYVEEQAIDRAHRIGQRYHVQVHRIIVEETVEDRILKLQEQKRSLVESALDENAGKSISRLGTRELSFLFGITNNLGSAT